MKPSLRAAIFSGLICPGLGYFLVGRRARGVLVMGLSGVFIVLVLMDAIAAANHVANALLAGQIATDPDAIMGAVHSASDEGMQKANFSMWALGALWLFSVVDGYRCGMHYTPAPAASRGAARRRVPAATVRVPAPGIATPAAASGLVRRAQETDLPGLLRLYRHLNADDPELDPLATLAHWRAMLANSMLQYFVIEQAGMPVSSCALTIIPNLTRSARPYALVENVVTHPDWRGRGFATQVLHAARDAAWRAGCYKLMLMTSRKDEATLRFYVRAGFNAGDKTAFILRPND